jgi:hypothetical protein
MFGNIVILVLVGHVELVSDFTAFKQWLITRFFQKIFIGHVVHNQTTDFRMFKFLGDDDNNVEIESRGSFCYKEQKFQKGNRKHGLNIPGAEELTFDSVSSFSSRFNISSRMTGTERFCWPPSC